MAAFWESIAAAATAAAGFLVAGVVILGPVLSLSGDSSTARADGEARADDAAQSTPASPDPDEDPDICELLICPENNDLTAPTRQTLDDALNPNNLNHVFGKPRHNLDPLVQQFGSRQAAMEEIVGSVGRTLPRAGKFEVVRDVGGNMVTIRGFVVDGVPRIGTAFIP